jgi:Biopolymer transport protein|nr:biopolymer transporter ExbD [uncultured Steroidobacter sp.]
MAMNVGGGGEGEPMLDINTTPLIDVMLVLLIMFIITLPVMTHAVKLDMPQARTPPPDQIQTQPIRVDIDWDGTVLWDGNVVTLEQLEDYFRSEAARRPQPELHVRPDRRSNYDTVAKVLAIAQRNGMQRIGFVGNEQFMNE